jgi:hypothetical protein
MNPSSSMEATRIEFQWKTNTYSITYNLTPTMALIDNLYSMYITSPSQYSRLLPPIHPQTQTDLLSSRV